MFGQTRSASKALLLSAEESKWPTICVYYVPYSPSSVVVVPVIADPSDGEAWADVAGKADVGQSTIVQ